MSASLPNNSQISSAPNAVNKSTPSSSNRALVRLLIGNTSKPLMEKKAGDFTHRWTVFVRATGPEQFTDRSFIRKVKFNLHPSFSNPNREIKKPPFEITECGYGSFDMEIIIHFAGIQKTFKISHTLDLVIGHENECVAVNKIEVHNPPPEFMALLQKYCRPLPKEQQQRMEPKPKSIPINHSPNTKLARVDRICFFLDSLQKDVDKQEDLLLSICEMLIADGVVPNHETESLDIDFGKLSESTLDALEKMIPI